MDFKKITKLFIFISFLIIVGYDIWVIFFGGVESSISRTIVAWSFQFPAFTVSVGFLMGHLFWPQKVKETVYIYLDPLGNELKRKTEKKALK